MEGGLMENAAERPHVLAVPFPFIGHMTPIVQLCKMVVAMARCRVTIACSERGVPSLRRLLPEKHEEHHIMVLPISDGLPVDLGLTWDTSRNVLRSIQEGLPRYFGLHIQSFSDVVCVLSDVYDLSWTQDVADQLGVPRLAVWVSAAAEYQVYFHAKDLVKAGKLPFKAPLGKDNGIDNMIPTFTGRPPIYHRIDGICEEEEEIKISGLSSLNRRDFPTFLQIEDSSDEFFYTFIEHIKTGLQASILLFNSFEALEGCVLDTMRSQGIPARSIGPLFLLENLILNQQVQATQNENTKMNEVQSGEGNPECLKWLDGQKPKSVIYVAFGTLIHLTKAQVRELALGLLYSGQPFIWAYPEPSRNEVAEGRPELPEGFLDQVKDRGLVLEWAPQKRILSHPSTGGFLSHCGWNSAMESICSGVPILCLPYVSDQSLHCKMMVEEWKVGLRLERSPDEGVALADDIARLTRELLVGVKGEELRKRAEELKVAAQSSIQPGGCSHSTLDAIIKLVK